MAEKLVFNGENVGYGQRKFVHIDIAKLYDSTAMTLDFEVLRGAEDGPVLFVLGALHGDEINGVEIIRKLLALDNLKLLKGTLIAVPIVNAYGFNTKSRYLPDRRDLNRCFPGSSSGSLASRLAHVLQTEVIDKSTHGIDLHTGAINRTNLPQIRAVMNDENTFKMAKSFGASVALDEPLREGSLRHYCYENGITSILYEGGEALRFEKKAIAVGLNGVLRTMIALDMLPHDFQHEVGHDSEVLEGGYWVRAPKSGMLISEKRLGDRVDEGERLGFMTDSLNRETGEITAPHNGIIVGCTTTPLLNQGDAAYHIAKYS
ncbi:MAG: succinylglutamate desuccinylase [Micavibrio sp.]|nr:succinylglutamate desuccinylase [Micavibrio sp.]|tara:strand:- start:800609 stop:801562 length:954 start_codon:yes stop_codon:yes gene_type:complete